MGCYEARATVDWQGFGGTVESASGMLSTATAAQVELGGPGGATNPEELFAAAHANCFTSTITSMARARGIDLAHVVTEAQARLEWSEGSGDHHLAASDLSVRLTSQAAEGDLRTLVGDATDHCPVCQAISGNVPMRVKIVFERPAP
jgi:osmotically inducible protein OsmC